LWRRVRVGVGSNRISEGDQMVVDMKNTSHYSARKIQYTPMTGKVLRGIGLKTKDEWATMIAGNRPRVPLDIHWDPLGEVK
jgi:hypothetical protein